MSKPSRQPWIPRCMKIHSTQHNLERLKEFWLEIIEPREAVLACGDHGTGALAMSILVIEKVKGNYK